MTGRLISPFPSSLVSDPLSVLPMAKCHIMSRHHRSVFPRRICAVFPKFFCVGRHKQCFITLSLSVMFVYLSFCQLPLCLLTHISLHNFTYITTLKVVVVLNFPKTSLAEC
ncbi:hypothetical protein P9112_005999 [Eukaryota sp. TZLM1-RC]